MQPSSEAERLVLCPDRIILECRCGWSLILLGREEDWYVEGRATFECSECRGNLTLADRSYKEGPHFVGSSFGEESMSVKELIRSLRAEGR